MTTKTCLFCKKSLPLARRKHAIYCSESCYNAAKRERSNTNYSEQKGIIKGFRINERLLAQFYPLAESKQPILYDTLNALGFDWGISQSEKQDINKKIWKGIGQYYYFINPDKTILIWKDSTLSPKK